MAQEHLALDRLPRRRAERFPGGGPASRRAEATTGTRGEGGGPRGRLLGVRIRRNEARGAPRFPELRLPPVEETPTVRGSSRRRQLRLQRSPGHWRDESRAHA